MKHEESEILKGLGKETGFKVPQNYFEEFNKHMLDSLPQVEKHSAPVGKVVDKPSMWLRVRPFLYAAAACAGIVCMTQVFNSFNGTNDTRISEIAKGVENSEEVVKEGATSDQDVMTYEDSVKQNLELDAESELKTVSDKE